MRGITTSLLVALAAFGAAQSPVWQKRTLMKRGEYTFTSVVPRWTKPTPVQRAFMADVDATIARNLKELRESAQEDTRRYTYSMDFKVDLSISRPDLVSARTILFMDTGGAHPNTLIDARTYALVGGTAKRIVLRDLLQPGVTPTGFLKDTVLPRLNIAKAGKGIAPVDSIDPSLADKFVLTPSGISYVFGPYDVGAYAEGAYDVPISFASAGGKLRTQISRGPDVSGVLSVSGRVGYRERIALLPGSELVLTIDTPNRQTVVQRLAMDRVPMPFSLSVARQPGSLLRAEIHHDGKVIFRTGEPIRLDRSHSNLEITLVRAPRS